MAKGYQSQGYLNNGQSGLEFSSGPVPELVDLDLQVGPDFGGSRGSGKQLGHFSEASEGWQQRNFYNGKMVVDLGCRS